MRLAFCFYHTALYAIFKAFLTYYLKKMPGIIKENISMGLEKVKDAK